MASLARLRISITGSDIVGPGVMTFYSSGLGEDLQVAAHELLEDLETLIPDATIFDLPSAGDMIDDVDGSIVGTWTATAPLVASGTAGGAFMLGTGFGARWETAGVVAGRHVRGRTFFVPAVSTCFTTAGYLDSTVGTTIQTALSTFVTAVGGNLRIWSRPVPGRSGSSHVVTSGAPISKPVWLTTRKN